SSFLLSDHFTRSDAGGSPRTVRAARGRSASGFHKRQGGRRWTGAWALADEDVSILMRFVIWIGSARGVEPACPSESRVRALPACRTVEGAGSRARRSSCREPSSLVISFQKGQRADCRRHVRSVASA